MNQLKLRFQVLSSFNSCYENFKHTQKKTELYNETPCTYHPDSTVIHIFPLLSLLFLILKILNYAFLNDALI